MLALLAAWSIIGARVGNGGSTATSAPTPTPHCSPYPRTSFDMMACSYSEAQKADAVMNALYQKLLRTAPSALDREKLVAAQSAWLAYRKAEVDAEHPRDSAQPDGFMFSTCVNQTYLDLTTARIRELRLLQPREGDVCHQPWGT